jgi:hypothetical protein
MKNYKIFITIPAIIVGIVLVHQAITFPTRGFGDSTGAPNKNEIYTAYTSCRSSSCHVGRALNSSLGSVDIISDIPESGWLPNETYVLKCKISYPNRDVYGFQLMAWGDKDSASVGNFIKTSSDSAIVTKSILRNVSGKIIDTNEYATHNSKNILAANNTFSKEWTIRWKAPANRNQEVKFYATFLAANGNGGSSGDNVFMIHKNADASSIPLTTDEYQHTWPVCKIYPSIAEENLTVELSMPNRASGEISIYNLKGEQVSKNEFPFNPNNSIKSIYIGDLPNGMYHIQVSNGDLQKTMKFIKK